MKKSFKPLPFFLLSFFFSGLALASISFPSQWGEIEGESDSPGKKTLILIQEPHVHYEAHKAIAQILKTLIQNYSLRLVLVEGGWGDVNLASLRNYASLESRQKVADEYLKKGKISGAEYLQLASNLEMTIWGVEDAALYQENLNAFLAFEKRQEEFLGEWKKLKSTSRSFEEKVFSPELKNFRRHKKAFEDQAALLLPYLEFLLSRAGQNPAASHPHLKTFAGLLGGEGAGHENAQWEKRNLIAALSRTLPKAEFEALKLAREPKDIQEEIETIESLLEVYPRTRNQPTPLKTAGLENYLAVLKKISAIPMRALFQELGGLESEVMNRMNLSAGERQASSMAENIDLLGKLLALQVSPEEFTRVRAIAWKNELESWRRLTGAEADWGKIEEGVSLAQPFYEVARRREEALVRNALEKIKAENAPITTIIAGGFHSERLLEAFRAQGLNVLLVTPRFQSSESSENQHQKYLEILKLKFQGGESS